jgi:hypothetical protein
MGYLVVAERGRTLEDTRAGVSQRIPATDAHATQEGAHVTECGRRCTDSETFPDLQWPPGVGVEMCRQCAAKT